MNSAFIDIPGSWFPIRIDFFRAEDVEGRQPVHIITMDDAGAAHVPRLSDEYGPVWCRITDGAGVVRSESRPEES